MLFFGFVIIQDLRLCVLSHVCCVGDNDVKRKRKEASRIADLTNIWHGHFPRLCLVRLLKDLQI